MAEKKYLDLSGLTHFLTKIKAYITNQTTMVQNHMTTTQAIADNSKITIPVKYKVGNDSLEVYCMGEKLVKARPDQSQDGHYIEVGSNGSISNQIQLYNIGQSVPVGITFGFVVNGKYE